MSSPGVMNFRRFGRSYHLIIETADDLERVLELDEAHWVATGAPIETINCDWTFLTLVDTDRNGRIMCFEMTDAIRWLRDVLRDHGGVTSHSRSLRLDAINTGHPDGERIRQSAVKILRQAGVGGKEEIALEQVREIKRKVEATPVSEAGVVLPEASKDEEIRQFLADVLATVGGASHPSGSEGVAQEQLDRFLSDAQAYLEWHARGELPGRKTKTDIMPLGAETAAAFEALSVGREKVEQYFAQSRAAALDARLAGRMSPREAELDALDLDDPAVIEQVLKDAPLAKPTPERVLSFEAPLNPYYAERVAALRSRAVEPVLGKPTSKLTEPDWEEVKSAFAAHARWLAEKPGDAVEPLGADKLTLYLEGRFRKAVEALIAESADTAFVLDNIRLTEKLILYQAHMIALANNFVSFPDLYDEKRRAMFEMGTLVCDGRRFNMSVRTGDRAQHSAVAKTSNMYVLYLEVTAREGGAKYELAVPVTSGGKGNLCVGKRGLFVDVEGTEFDAKVVQIIENPISLGEALVSPFQRVGRAVTGKIESITTEAERKLETGAATAVTQVGAPAGKAAGGSGLMAGGLLMGGGVALAALGSALAYITKTLSEANPWAIVGGIGGAVLAVLLPIAIVAIIKLRRRDLSAILEGSGWAINARMRLTRRQSRFFTRRPAYPAGARGIRRRRWIVIVAAAVIAALIALGVVFGMRGRKVPKQNAPTPPAGAASD